MPNSSSMPDHAAKPLSSHSSRNEVIDDLLLEISRIDDALAILSQEQRDLVMQAHEAGASTRLIASVVHADKSSINRWIRKSQMKPEP